MKINKNPHRESCKSCGQHFRSTSKIVPLPNGESVSFQEDFCNKCISRYVTRVDELKVENYSHISANDGLTIPRNYKEFME